MTGNGVVIKVQLKNTRCEMNTTRLDYSKLIHRNEQFINGYTKRNSFYIQKGNGNAGSYRGNYKGDYSVFRATRQQFGGDTMSMIREAEADEIHCKDCIWFRRYTYGYYECANEFRGGRIEKYYTCEYAEKKQECE